METINATNSMSNQVQGLERAPRVNEIKPEEEKPPASRPRKPKTIRITALTFQKSPDKE